MTITLADIKAVRPCWEPSRLEARVPAKGVTYLQIAQAEDVSVEDRRWLLTQLAARTREGRKLLILWAAGCAQDVVHLIPEGDLHDASLNCIAAATRWAEEPSDAAAADAAAADAAAADASAAARDAAYAAAAYAAAASAAYAAAYAVDAAYAADAADAAAAAAYAADAARDAAYAAAAYAADAARDAAEQLIDLATALENAGL